ncbi:hypothetical protein [uncultured Litoreibacter sp.]|uniref:GTA head formation protein, RCAP_rcc01685 family n=1 Tax=uncultured Litoreibacter sp. TaxID=1392394 RepID=UPI00260BBBB9|nr:hypothetical protein [uncultured Litoreibacter sp.]
MSDEKPQRAGGSRYLYEPFEYARADTVQANERVQDERWRALEYRLGQIEQTLERVERRVWFTIFGVTAAVLSETVTGLLGGAGL